MGMAPIGLFQRLKTYYWGAPDEPKPAIATTSAAALSILYTLIYVLPFYLSSATRPSPTLTRDSPSVIRARIRAVTFSCIVTSLATLYVVYTWDEATIQNTAALLGYWPISISDIARTVCLTAILFAGPIFERGIVEGGWREWIRGRSMLETLGSWMGWRNYVAGPITEEVVFRSAIIPLHLLALLPPSNIVFLTPLYFGIAHIHHLYEYSLTHPHTRFLPALLRSLLQFGYTSVFGFYATFVYLRTASLPAVILAHSFCNWCGLPRLWGRVEAGVPLGVPASAKSDAGAGVGAETEGAKGAVQVRVSDRAGSRLGPAWTVAYYALLVAGAIGFWKGLWVLTESERALVKF